jgi:hypothetical protein
VSIARAWYDSLFKRAYPPAQSFAKGLAVGAGVPTSVDQAKQLATTLLGTMFGVPEVYSQVGQGLGSTVEAVGHPIETGKVLASAARQNPAGAAGVALGMALPLPDELAFGGKALSSAERRMTSRVMAERARVHAGLEGKTGPLPEIKVGPEPHAELVRTSPTAVLLRSHKLLKATEPEYAAELAQELARRGVKTDISDELHVLHEGRPVGIPEPFTAEERGGKMIARAGIKKTDIYGVPLGPSWAQKASTELSHVMPYKQPGQTLAYGGGRWLNTKRGWTRVEGTPQPKDFDWIFERQFDKEIPPIYAGAEDVGSLMDMPTIPASKESNIERAVELVQEHGGLQEREARKLVARRIADRAKAGKATTQEIVWLNLHGARMLGRGFKWHQ